MRYSDVESYEDFQATLNKPSEEPYTTFVKGLYYTGTRESELTRVTSEDVYWDREQPIFLNVKVHTLKNKRSKVRVIPINKEIEPQAIELFLNAKSGKLPEEPLFWDRVVKEETFLRNLRRKVNELYDGVAPHFFRHCRLTHCITRFNYSDYELMQYAGWTDVRPGSFYVHLRVQNLQAKMR